MQYFDKSKNGAVALDHMDREFLVKLDPDEAEGFSMPGSLIAVGGSIRASTPGSFLVTLPKEAEALQDMQKTMGDLADAKGVDFVASSYRQADGSSVFVVPARIAVVARGLTEAKAKKAFDKLGLTMLPSGRSKGLYVVETAPGTDLSAAIAALNELPEVMLAEPVFVGVNDAELTATVSISVGSWPAPQGEVPAATPSSVPASPPGVVRNADTPTADVPTAVAPATDGGDHAVSWNHDRIRASAAWAVTRGSDRVLIAVADGSPEADHSALKDAILRNLPAETVFADNAATSAHATGVASLALGRDGAFTGVAPGCRLLPLVVDLAVQEYWRRADAIFYAAELAAQKVVADHSFDRMVLCCSWKMSGDISTVRMAIGEAVAAGVLVVTSAGNNNTKAPHYPSDYSADAVFGAGVISVGATDRNDRRASYSNWSARVDLCAPGGDGLPLDDGDLNAGTLFNSYAPTAGTSFAAPQVAGVAALMLSVDPTLTVGRIKDVLRATTDPVVSDVPTGTGRINAGRALAALGGTSAESDDRPPDHPRGGPSITITLGDTTWRQRFEELAADLAVCAAARGVRLLEVMFDSPEGPAPFPIIRSEDR